MSSWTALTWHIWIKTAFRPNISNKIFLNFYYEDFKILRVIGENAYIKKYSTLQQGTRKIGF